MKVKYQEGRVGVIIPAYNRERTIGRSIESVLNQTMRDVEIYVVDDHSQDQTAEIAQSYAKKEERIHVLRTIEKGAQAARNTGIRAAKDVRYIALLDSDDTWKPEMLEQTTQLADKQNASIVYCDSTIIYDQSGREVAVNMPDFTDDPFSYLLQRPPGPIFGALVARRQTVQEIGYLDETIQAFQEWDTTIRLAEQFGFAFLDKAFFEWHRHDGPSICSNPLRNADGYAQVVEKHREKIIEFVGEFALACHYTKLAELNHNNGRVELSQDFLKKALSICPNDLRVRRFARNLLSGLPVRSLDQKIQIFGEAPVNNGAVERKNIQNIALIMQ